MEGWILTDIKNVGTTLAPWCGKWASRHAQLASAAVLAGALLPATDPPCLNTPQALALASPSRLVSIGYAAHQGNWVSA